MKKEPFSVKVRGRSFRYAWQGLLDFFQQEHNARIHLGGTIVAVLGIILLPVSRIEIIAIVIVIGLVWMAELFNTAIEKIMDHLSPNQHPNVKLIKDMAAGAVLISALVALATGLLIFIPKI